MNTYTIEVQVWPTDCSGDIQAESIVEAVNEFYNILSWAKVEAGARINGIAIETHYEFDPIPLNEADWLINELYYKVTPATEQRKDDWVVAVEIDNEDNEDKEQ